MARKRPSTFTCFIGISLFVVLVAHPLSQQSDIRDRDATWIAPVEADAKRNPLAGRPELVAGGEKLFRQRCTECHGDDGRGTSKAPDLTHRDIQAQTDGALFWKISGGNTHAGMPSFSFLPGPQRWQLVLQLRALVETTTDNVRD